MAKAGFAVDLLETRHVRDAFKAMAARTGKNKAKVALARKLAIMLVDGTPFAADKAAMIKG